MHAPVWLFDLDNTLHHADVGIFHIINRRMTEYIAAHLGLSTDAASDLRQDYWHRYGATLAGLQRHHPEIDLAEFLRASHPLAEIAAALQPVAGAAAVLAALPGRKAVFSNGPAFYVQALVEALALRDHFEAVFGTEDFGWLYKPAPQAYLNVCTALGVRTQDCVLVDDSAANLRAAKALGMRTVWFGSRTHSLPFADAAAADMAAVAAYAKAVFPDLPPQAA